MSGETKDPAIKLFGKTIPLPDIAPTVARGVDDNDRILPQSPSSSPEHKEREDDEELLDGNQSTNAQADEVLGQISSSKDSTLVASTGTSENPRSPSSDETVPSKDSRPEEEQNETSKNSQEKTLKKPDKILPCPRCNSMETKFCYYNNYNVNQPRHFCKNCQRYWTAGGTMRNVPVGAGRRKNKSSSSNNYRHLTISEALHKVPNGQLNPNGGTPVLAFGSDSRLCESMASVLNLAEKTLRNGFHTPGEVKVHGPNSDSGLTGKAGKPQTNGIGCPGFPTQVPYYPGPHWPYPWTPVPPPAFCPPGYTMPAFYPGPPYWGWNVPWLPQPSSPCSISANSSSGPNSPTLGKHSRDEAATFRSNGSREDEPFKDANNTDRSLWTPKTLRIDDPREAAKSSIWATLGIRSDKTDSVTGGGLFKAFQPKGDERKLVPEASSFLQANPAALSRSLNFHETS